MTTLRLTRDQVVALRPCSLSKIPTYGMQRSLTAAQALKRGVSIPDLLWVAGQIGRKDLCVRFALACAQRQAHLNTDPRVQKALDATQAWLDNPSVSTAARSAYDAARSATSAARSTTYAAYDAARSATYAATSAASAADSAAYDAAASAADAAARSARSAAYDAAARSATYAATSAARSAAYDAAYDAAYADEKVEQEKLFLEIFKE